MSKPSDSDIRKAIGVCEDLAAHIKETEPYAVYDIATLEHAIETLHDIVVLEHVIETLSGFTGDYDE